MAVHTLYKLEEGQVLVVMGHFTKAELYWLNKDGYRVNHPKRNKNGIGVA